MTKTTRLSTKPILKTRKITHKRVTWRGFTLKLVYTWKHTTFHYAAGTMDHVAIYFDRADAAFIPLSTTGYRSYYVQTRALRDAGGPVAYILAELDRAARDPTWLKSAFKARQLDLFDV